MWLYPLLGAMEKSDYFVYIIIKCLIGEIEYESKILPFTLCKSYMSKSLQNYINSIAHVRASGVTQ